MRLLIVSILLSVLAGCVDAPQRYYLTPPPAAEVPIANLPKELHERNWVDRKGSGSCVHASTLFVMRWQGQ